MPGERRGYIVLRCLLMLIWSGLASSRTTRFPDDVSKRTMDRSKGFIDAQRRSEIDAELMSGGIHTAQGTH